MEKVAILGGTFDPVHWGHLSMAHAALCQFGLDRVVWSVDRTPGHKLHSVLATFEQRREMVAVAISQRPDFGLLPIDTNPSAVGAIDSVLYLQNLYPQAELYWIIGADAFQTLPKWPWCGEIAALCQWLVAGRRTGGREELHSEVSMDAVADKMLETNTVCAAVAQKMSLRGVQLRWQVLAMPEIEVSSTAIRHYCRQGRAIEHLVPDAVRTYIVNHQLYQS